MSEKTKDNFNLATIADRRYSELYTIDEIIQRLQQAEKNSIPLALVWMKEQGSSVLLNWGEDDNCWECSWITSGERMTGVDKNMTSAIVCCLLRQKHRLTRLGQKETE
jgi:hypothetical protein